MILEIKMGSCGKQTINIIDNLSRRHDLYVIFWANLNWHLNWT